MENTSGTTETIIAIVSPLIALIALVVAINSEKRSREVLKMQTYLSLRSRFLDIYRELGPLEELEANDTNTRLARQAYWHHVWDEWYITNQMAPREFSSLWYGFFALAVKSGYDHKALRITLDEMAAKTNEGFGLYAKPLVKELQSSAFQNINGETSTTQQSKSTKRFIIPWHLRLTRHDSNIHKYGPFE